VNPVHELRNELELPVEPARLHWACGIATMLAKGPGLPSPGLLRHLDEIGGGDGPRYRVLQICNAVMVLTDPRFRRRGYRHLRRHVQALERLGRLGTTRAAAVWRTRWVDGPHPLDRWTIHCNGERRLLEGVPTVLVAGFCGTDGALVAIPELPDELAEVALGVWSPFDDGPLSHFPVAVAAAQLLTSDRAYHGCVGSAVKTWRTGAPAAEPVLAVASSMPSRKSVA
jgi:GNAT superfamily N-acetyltransferase